MTYLLLGTGLTLSAIAAFYAVAGLVAIFAASAIPIMIMGAALEVSKLVVASWLYRNWKHIPVLMKTYFTSALVILMLLTSMGIFGYLSKAHLDQAVPVGEVAAKLSIIDEKIKTQKENIDAARRALAQLDSQVEQTISRTTDSAGTDRSIAIRRGQAKERAALYQDIQKAQTEIAKLNEERSPIAAEVRKVEAEVGPIKYIAALIYGSEVDDTLLEKAVRIVIIMIVIVFDPLAVLLLIAWNREQGGGNEPPPFDRFFKKPPTPDFPDVKKEPSPEFVETPTEKPKTDWQPEIYKRAELKAKNPPPESIKSLLDEVNAIAETTVITKEEAKKPSDPEYTISSDIQQVLEKPTNGRPERYK